MITTLVQTIPREDITPPIVDSIRPSNDLDLQSLPYFNPIYPGFLRSENHFLAEVRRIRLSLRRLTEPGATED